MPSSHILKLRIQWFRLKAREFIRRYFAGFLVLIVFLPGVSIGDNFKLFMTAATKPFLIVVLSQGTLVVLLFWLFIIASLVIVWARAQRMAISGGAFAIYMQSLPLSENLIQKNNLYMLLIANHLLWVFISTGLFFLNQSSNVTVLDNFRYVFLILLLICLQYVSVFKPKKFNFLIISIISVVYLLPTNNTIQWMVLITIFLILALFIKSFVNIKQLNYSTIGSSFNSQKPYEFTHNLYLQILFKSGLSSSLFRFSLIIGIMIGFSLLANHFTSLNENDLRPYAYVIEAIIAYYLSGFYVSFADERKKMQALFDSLPLKKIFWFKRDVLILILIALMLHAGYFIWAQNHFRPETLQGLLLFNILLLCICYPLRTLVKNSQTFISFVVLFSITAITLFNLL
jgi:hypothetical protein